MKLGLAQLDIDAAALTENRRRAVEAIERAADAALLGRSSRSARSSRHSPTVADRAFFVPGHRPSDAGKALFTSMPVA
ncbi:hypothetical protein BRC96_03020 [Halobacteriales archaeon QS_6_64_34]|nr:MAG: hypothetical protein BRC96_03020 [Halobacteriales archaeon QS_6_64_34]